MADLKKILHERFGFAEFRTGQLDIIQSILEKKDTLAVMPTGGGKSLCYQLPALVSKGLVVVISPLIALMDDQVRSLRKVGVGAGCLHSNQSYEEKKDTFTRLKESEGFLLYLSPERVQKEGFAAWIQKQNPVLFAIDEAHCVSQWGHDFREDYSRLTLLRELCPNVPILALTATATPQVGNDIARRLGMNHPQRHVYGFYRPNLYYQVHQCDDEQDKRDFLLAGIEATPKGRIIVYCGTRNSCEQVSELIGEKFDGVDYYHAGLTPEHRTKVQQDYDEGRTRILCATNAFGMGIDHPDVRLILHYQMPANVESYYQEAGRAGRDGEPATCALMYSRKDKGLQSFFIRGSSAPKPILNYRWRALDAIVNYCEGGECRQGEILTYFRDTKRMDECGHCDACDPSSSLAIVAPVASSFVGRTVTRKKRKKSSKDEEPVTPEVADTMEAIRAWRLDYANKHDVPAFVIFSNKTLKDLAKKSPTTEDELLGVYGLGPAKVEKFGRELLGLFQ